MSKSLDLKFLYHFSCTSSHVLEVKVNGLEEGTPLNRVYHWLYYNRTTQQFQNLGFKSMESKGGREHRIFEQGELCFDTSRASLKLKTDTTSREFILDVKDVKDIPDELISQVQHFLQQQNR